MDEKADQSAPVSGALGAEEVLMEPLLKTGRRLGLGRAATYAAYHSGAIPGIKFGKQIMVSRRWTDSVGNG